MLHIYCGDGKGKTTAAIGLAVRGIGAGIQVQFVQFLKGSYTSELAILESIPRLTVRRCDRDYGFYKSMSEQDKLEIKRCHNELLESAFSDPAQKMIILDEFCGAYNYRLMDRALAERLILENKDNAEVILTGRVPAEMFLDAADYISEIQCVRHPYERGTSARKGVEF